MQAFVTYGWYVALVLEAALLWKVRREHSAFALWLAVDLILWAVLVPVEYLSPSGMFVTLWPWCQIPLLGAVALAAVEQVAPAGWRPVFFLGALCAAELGCLEYPRLMYGPHVAMSGVLAIALVVRWVLSGMSSRGVIMCAFLAVDAAGYLAECFGSLRFQGAAFLIAGQGLCLAAWLGVEWNRRQYESVRTFQGNFDGKWIG